jgi:hypothetical protein
LLTALISYLIVYPNLQKQNARLLSDQQKSADLLGQVLRLQSQIQTLASERDACKAKFERATILYDVGFFNAESRAWVIPVDVEPKSVGVKRGTFSHYDPKTQTETVHFNAASQ